MVNFEKKLGLGQTPAPLLGPNSQLLPKICFASFPYYTSRVGLEKAAKILEKIELDINKMLWKMVCSKANMDLIIIKLMLYWSHGEVRLLCIWAYARNFICTNIHICNWSKITIWKDKTLSGAKSKISQFYIIKIKPSHFIVSDE